MVLYVCYSMDLFVVDHCGDSLDECSLEHLIWNLGNDYLYLSSARLFGVNLAPNGDSAASGAVTLDDPLAPANHPTGREIRSLNKLHQIRQVRFGIIEQVNHRVAQFGNVMRGKAGRHPYSDSLRAVRQQRGKLTGQDLRFGAGIVIVGLHVDRIKIEVIQHSGGDGGHAGLGVSHRRRRVPIDRSKVALRIYQRITKAPTLPHANQCRINHSLTVGMVISAGVTCDLGALAMPCSRSKVQIVHSHQHPALGRL